MTSPLRLTGPNTDVAAFYCFTYSEGAVLNLDNLPSVTAEITERFPREVVQVQGCAIITCSCETVDQDKQLTSQWLRWFCGSTHTHTHTPELGSFLHPCEGDLVCKGSNEKIPYFNAPLYLENKSQIGKVDDIFGPMHNYVSSMVIIPPSESECVPFCYTLVHGTGTASHQEGWSHANC